MRKISGLALPFIFAALFTASACHTIESYAGERFEVKPFFKEKEADKTLARKKGLFRLNLDIQVGFSISNTSFDLNRTDTSVNYVRVPGTKVGPNIGAIFSADFLGYGFSSGFLYSSKGFKNSAGQKTSLNYFNIPMLFYFSFDLDRVIIDGNAGPYFGLLLSQVDDLNNVPFAVKNFDFGLTGDIQGAYMFQKNFGALLGARYEYGGLNNLGSNEAINSIRTSTFFIYTGFKFVL
jgi:hypothetical protein